VSVQVNSFLVISCHNVQPKEHVKLELHRLLKILVICVIIFLFVNNKLLEIIAGCFWCLMTTVVVIQDNQHCSS